LNKNNREYQEAFLRMKKILKHISAVSLWLAGLALSAHMVFPHDHHLSDSFSDQDIKCPVTDNKSGHIPGYPIHCHSFNDLALEKARLHYISQNIQFSFIGLSNFPKTSDFDIQFSCSTFYTSRNTFFDFFTLELSLLRAPPAIA
jgi:hypothetical protein